MDGDLKREEVRFIGTKERWQNLYTKGMGVGGRLESVESLDYPEVYII